MSLLLLFLAPCLSRGQTYTNETISREVSVFNSGLPSAPVEAISREVSVFNFGQPSATYEAISREVSLFNFGQPSANLEAISREVSVFNFGQPSAGFEAISREVSIFNLGLPSANVEAISREVSVYNLGAQYLVLTLGSTVLRAGDTGGVPVTLFSLTPITNIQFTVDFPTGCLTNWAVNPSGSLTGAVPGSTSNQAALMFNPPGGETFVNTQQLGQINFTAASNQPSAFLPLRILEATGPLVDGTLTQDKRFHNGEIVVIHKHPLLRTSKSTKGNLGLTLYGLPGTNYTIEATTNLNPPVVWTPVVSTSLTNFIFNLGDLEMTNPVMFYRAQQ